MKIKDRLPIGEKIKLCRKSRGMTQAALAAILDVSPVNISQIETGQRSPTIDTVKAIADALEISISALMGIDSVVDTPENLNALKSVMNSSGYDLVKVHGEFYLTGQHGGYLLTEKQVLDLLNSSIQYVGYLCSRIEVEHIRGSFGLPDPPPQPPDAPVSPQESTDTTSDENPPEGD